jgi:hypothetical protein
MRKEIRNRAFLWALAGITAIGGVLRCIDLDASLWLDEILTYQRARGTLGYCLTNLTTPFHEMITHLSLNLGRNEVFLRLPNVVVGLFSIVLIYFVARSLYGRVAGLIAALLLSTSNYHLLHSQWARYYALMMLAGLLWAWLLHRCVTQPGVVNWVAYTITCFFGLLVHQFCILFLAFMGLGAAAWVLVSRSVPGARPKLRRLGLLLLCTTLGASGLAGTLMAQGKTPLQHLVAEQGNAQDAQQQSVIGKSPVETPSRLSVSAYMQFWDEMFCFLRERRNAKYLFLPFGLCGLLVTLWRRPSFGFIAFSAFFLLPIPLLVFTVSHQYGNRYFSPLVPIGYVLMSGAIVSTSRWTARRIFRDIRTNEDGRGRVQPRARIAANLLVILLLGLLTPSTVSGLERYYRWHPRWDWKEVARHITQTLSPNDVLYFIDPSKSQYNITLTYFYMDYFLRDSEAYTFSVKQFVSDLDAATLRRLACEFPESTIWFCALAGEEGAAGKLLDGACKTKRKFNGVVLWCLGEPTTNLVPNGGFEAADSERGNGEDSGVLVSGSEAFEGEHALRFQLSEPATKQWRVCLLPLSRSVEYPIRNAGFEAWTDTRPVGWDLPGQSVPFVKRAPGAGEKGHALALLETAEPVFVSQGITTTLAAGATVEVRAQGMAKNARQLAIELVCQTPEGPHRQVAYHPGTGQWSLMALHEKLPPNVLSNTIAVRLVREPGAEEAVCVDDVHAVLHGVTASLDPEKTYTLSMMLRYEGLRPQRESANAWAAASIVLSYGSSDGKNRGVHLMRFYGSSDWRPVVFPLKPGRDLPRDVSWLQVSVLMYGRGTIWIDNVQLEAKDHQTPFVDGSRPPHDEYIPQVLEGTG